MTKQDMLAEIIKYYGLEKNIRFAEFFDISPQLALSRKKQGVLDYEELYRRCREISPDWLLSGGEGPMLRADRGEQVVVVEPPKDAALAGAVGKSGGGAELMIALTSLAKEQEALARSQEQVSGLIEILRGNKQ